MADDWTSREARARTALDVLDFLVGRFRVRGRAHGEPFEGVAESRRVLGGTWLETRERTPDHEELCLYRLEPGLEQLVVEQLTAPGWKARYGVLPLEGGGVHWVPANLGPRVRLVPTPLGYRAEVRLPGDAEPAVVADYEKLPENEGGSAWEGSS